MTAAPAALVRVALPRGELREPLAARLDAAGFRVPGYGEGSRAYRFAVTDRPAVAVRVFTDRDIPIQVALGQYALGITRAACVEELRARFGHDTIVALRALDLGGERLVVAAPAGGGAVGSAAGRSLRVATEYPHIAARWLHGLGAVRYQLFDVWGEAEAWPPEDADIAVVPGPAAAAEGLRTLATVHEGPAWLIANRRALAERDLTPALDALLRLPAGPPGAGMVPTARAALVDVLAQSRPGGVSAPVAARASFRIAVPDGHAQRHTVAALAAAGLAFAGYDAERTARRPLARLGAVLPVEVKVLRPQDMPRAVALGGYDLALTGRDWLAAHQAAFPAAPVVELADLRRSRYALGAVVSEDVPATCIADALAYWRRDDPARPIRVASEYAALADHYARERRLGRYRVIPIAGASEGFVPDDAEILIEGSETGATLRANRLRMIDVLMESTNCAIGAAVHPGGVRGALRDELVERLARGAATVEA